MADVPEEIRKHIDALATTGLPEEYFVGDSMLQIRPAYRAAEAVARFGVGLSRLRAWLALKQPPQGD